MKDKDFRGRKLKERLKKVGNESVTNCHTLKMLANDEKMRETDILSTTKNKEAFVERIVKFLKEANIYYLATLDEDKPIE